MTTKTFDTLDVLTVYTGRMLKQGADFHGVMDHLYPGIMTIGTAAMQPSASAVILSQHPDICALGECTRENWRQWAEDARGIIGDTMDVEGPVDVTDKEIDAAFDAFLNTKRSSR